MGSYDGAKTCELVGVFILKSLEDKIDKQDIGLFRDDGLMILRNAKTNVATNVARLFFVY